MKKFKLEIYITGNIDIVHDIALDVTKNIIDTDTEVYIFMDGIEYCITFYFDGIINDLNRYKIFNNYRIHINRIIIYDNNDNMKVINSIDDIYNFIKSYNNENTLIYYKLIFNNFNLSKNIEIIKIIDKFDLEINYNKNKLIVELNKIEYTKIINDILNYFKTTNGCITTSHTNNNIIHEFELNIDDNESNKTYEKWHSIKSKLYRFTFITKNKPSMKNIKKYKYYLNKNNLIYDSFQIISMNNNHIINIYFIYNGDDVFEKMSNINAFRGMRFELSDGKDIYV